MAETRGENASIFRQSALTSITSADELDKYIKVTYPSAWVVLAAALSLIAGLAIWSLIAIIPTTIRVTGIAMGTEVTCWVDEATQEKMDKGGAYATVMGIEADTIELDTIPYSSAEIKRQLESDYLAEAMTLNDWNYEIKLTLPHEPEGMDDAVHAVPVSIVVTETHPLDLVLNSR